MPVPDASRSIKIMRGRSTPTLAFNFCLLFNQRFFLSTTEVLQTDMHMSVKERGVNNYLLIRCVTVALKFRAYYSHSVKYIFLTYS